MIRSRGGKRSNLISFQKKKGGRGTCSHPQESDSTFPLEKEKGTEEKKEESCPGGKWWDRIHQL